MARILGIEQKNGSSMVAVIDIRQENNVSWYRTDCDAVIDKQPKTSDIITIHTYTQSVCMAENSLSLRWRVVLT